MRKITFLIGLCFVQYQFVQAQSVPFNYTGGVQTYTVPPCVTSITVDVQGAQGGLGPVGCAGYQGLPGLGGRIQATLTVNPGDVLNIYVGGQGAPDNNTSAAGGFNGGGNAMMESNYTYYGGGGGGGASDIRLNGNALTDRIVVAGGGGGGGSDGCTCNGLDGGAGGGLTANAGSPGSVCSCNPSGQGGSQVAGGAKGDWGCNCDATAGSLGQGGNSNSSSCGGPTGGGAGGGGYYGGGGGGLGAGGGGSNYSDPSATGVTNTIGYKNGDGLVIITPNNGVSTPGPITGNASICANASGNYSIPTLVGATTYTWSVPTGTVINSGQGTTAINITAGNTSGNISVTATFACGTSAPGTLALTINPLPTVTANSTAAAVCAGNSVTLTGGGATSYAWSGGVIDAVSFIPVSTATYTVTGTDANGCTNTAMTTVTVNPLPTVTASSTASTVCAGASVTLTGGGATSYAWTAGVIDGVPFTPVASLGYTVTGTDANGCTNTATISITLVPLPTVSSTANPSTSVCTGSSVTLNGTGAATYVWTGGVTDGVSFVPASTLTYTVTGTDANGCTNTATTTVTVNPLPTVTASSTASTVCAGSSVTLTGGGATSYAWTGGVTDGVAFNPVSTVTYTVTGTDANGCTNTATTTVNVNPLPTVTAAASNLDVCLSDPLVTLTGTPANGTWSGPGVTGSSFNPSVAGAGSQTVTYTFTDVNGCTNTASVTISVNVCTGLADASLANGVNIFPNPNNGSFTLSINANVGDMTIEIVDMQGRVVSSSTEKNVQAGFSKQISMEKVSNGVYMLRLTTSSEQRIEKISVQK